jgi:signal transduction histidine kinase/DNA-binding response OmpR family regulator/ligand-binding sensor domain-containing protein
VCLFLSFSLSPPVSAQRKLLPVYHFNRLTTAEGLASNNALSRALRDSKGYVWVGTGNGLSRFDGYGFKNYRNSLNDSTSISSNMIFMVIEDRKHRLWVGSWDAGSSLYDPVHDHFVNFHPRPGDSTWLQSRTVWSAAVDSAGVLWLGTNGGGIVRVDLPETGDESDIDRLAHDIRFTTFPLGTPRNNASDVSVRADGRILVASDSGLLFIDRTTGSVSRPNLTDPLGLRLNSISVNFLSQDPNGILWMATGDGLYKLDWNNRKVENYRTRKGDSLSISSDSHLDIASDRRGNLWLASSKGVDLFTPSTGKRMPYLAYGPYPPGTAQIALSVDRTGTLWISNGGNGLYWLSEKSLRFPHYTHGSNGESPWGGESIERTRDGQIWICSYGSVVQLDVQTKSIVRFIDVLRGERGTYWDSNKRSSFLDGHGILWYGVWGPGLYRVNLATNQVKLFRYFDPPERDNAVRSIARGSGDSLWIGAAQEGLWKFDPASGKFVRGSSTTFGRANDVMQDRNGKLWVATILDGLYRVDPATDSVEHFVHDRSNPNSLSNDRTNNLYEDPSDRIWFGAVSVINLWNPVSRTFSRYPNPAFSDAHAVSVIGSDSQQRLWVSYADGRLAMFNPATGRFMNFDASDGVCGFVFDLENLDDGKVLLSGAGGLNIFDPDTVLQVHRTAPSLVITRMSINDHPVVPAASVDGSGTLNLSYDQDAIEIEFAALDIDAPQVVEYRYQLEGLEKEWVEPVARRYVRYPGLRPGEYVFRVNAVSPRGEWPQQEIALKVLITPPWWQSRWAYGGYALAMIALIAAAYRFRLKQIRLKQQAEMEHFQAERLAEVDKLKSRFFANISHEFRTPLTLIRGPVEQAIESTQDPATRQMLHLVRDNAKRLHSLVDQLLDFSRLESGMMRLQVAGGDIVPFLRRVVMSFESWAERKKINLEFQADVDSAMGFFDADKVEKVVNNLLSNALKFTQEQGAVRVNLTTSLTHPLSGRREWEVRVADTGPGISADHLTRIFDRFYRADETHKTEGTGIGLALTKELVEMHHGAIAVESTPGKGSEFRVTLPIEESSYKSEEISESPQESERDEQIVIGFSAGDSGAVGSQTPSAEGKPIVLVVEDNVDLRTYIRELLQFDYAVQEGSDGREGLDRALEIVPDLVISDVMMPGLDGLELCRALKQDVRTSHVPVILLTARAGTDSKIEGLDIGADDYVTKPFDSKELLARVRNLIEQRRQLRARFSAGVVLKPGEVAVSSLDDALLKRVMTAIEKQMSDESLGAETIAHEVALSRRHLDRKLMGLTNLSTAELIRYLRLQRARELLEKNAATVAEIAFQVGFGSPTYFTSCFRERFGCLPSEIRSKRI